MTKNANLGASKFRSKTFTPSSIFFWAREGLESTQIFRDAQKRNTTAAAINFCGSVITYLLNYWMNLSNIRADLFNGACLFFSHDVITLI